MVRNIKSTGSGEEVKPMLFRLPPSLKRRLAKAAKANNMTMNAFCIACFEQELNQQESRSHELAQL